MKQKRLLIYLHGMETQQVSWVRWNENNEITEVMAQGEFSALSHFASDLIYVIVPSEEVLLSLVQLPKLPRARLLSALPFALEDQLIPDIQELHFAMGKQQVDGLWPVAVVSKEKMLAWQDLFKGAELNPHALIPALFLLPWSADTWYVNTYEETCLVRTAFWSGFTSEKSQLGTLLDLKKIEEKLPACPPLIHTELAPHELLEKYGSQLWSTLPLNLLQGPFQPQRSISRTRILWKAVAGLLLTYVLLTLIGNTISFLILHNEARDLEKEIQLIYFRQFPKAKSFVAPRERMTEKLRKLQNTGDKNIYFILIGELGKSLLQLPSIKIQHFTFNDQRLTLELIAPSFDQVDHLIRNLTQANLSVKQQNATTTGKEVKVTLNISAGKI